MTNLACRLTKGLPASAEPVLSHDGAWLSVEVILNRENTALAGGTEAGLLETNASLRAAAKLCLPAAAAALPRLVLEAPAAWERAEEWVRSGLCVGSRCTHEEFATGRFQKAGAGEQAEIEASLDAARWRVVSSGDGTAVVELEGTRLAVSGEVVFGEYETGISAVVARTDASADAAGYQAVCRFLLRLAASVRMVRPYLSRQGDNAVFGMQISAPPRAEARELDDCLTALSIGVARVEEEAGFLLADEYLAAAYLQLGGGRQAEIKEPASIADQAVEDLDAGGGAGSTAPAAASQGREQTIKPNADPRGEYP